MEEWEDKQIEHCGICKIEVKSSEWEGHVKTVEHRNKEDKFFDNPDEAINKIMESFQLDSKVQAINVFNILRNIHEVKEITERYVKFV